MQEESKRNTYESFARRHQTSVDSVITLVEWLVVAFILALMFMTFAMQAFQIPTGSMAETLRGQHFTVRCLRCGFSFDVESSGLPVCPNCGYVEPAYAAGRKKNGDRIFVLKSIYQFFKPNRWDVVVFKNPTDPHQNYIKRLTGLPGDTVQLLNGDLYIDGRIQRKPAGVQEELWMPICLLDHQPFESADYFNEKVTQENHSQNHIWQPCFVNDPNSSWQTNGTTFTLQAPVSQEHTLVFQDKGPDTFRAVYGYNNESRFMSLPVVTDLMIRFYAKGDNPDGCIGASLEKFGVLYSARVEFDGALIFTKTVNGETTQLRAPMLTEAAVPHEFTKFEFANVDQRLVLHWGRIRFAFDLSNSPDFATQSAYYEKAPAVKVFASGPTEIRHLELYRDIFYSESTLRANADKPFALEDDEFFVCGDNCNNSLDARLWSIPGVGNGGKEYRTGTVPMDYMMGKAVMVYWAQPFAPMADSVPIIPNLESIKVIYGGSDQEY